MRFQLSYTVGVLLLVVCTFLPTSSRAGWKLEELSVSAMDLLPGGSGLIAFYTPGVRIEKVTRTSREGVFASMTTVRQIAIASSDIAFATVQDSGVYIGRNGWRTWTKIDTSRFATILLSSPFATILTNATEVKYFRLNRFDVVTGVSGADRLIAADYTSDSTIYAIGGLELYRSTDLGKTWSPAYTFAQPVNSLYIDRSRDLIFVGGAETRVSSDRGKTWKVLGPSTNGSPAGGTVHGTSDCTGAFYITAYGVSRSDMLFSNSHGEFVQSAGFAPTQLHAKPQEFIVLDRGSTLYWLQDGRLYSSINGAGVLPPDSPNDALSGAATSPIFFRMCREPEGSFTIDLRNSDCMPVIVDSIRQLTGIGKVATNVKFPARVEGTPLSLLYEYTTTVPGIDTVKLLAWIRWENGARSDIREFQLVAVSTVDPAALGITQLSLDFQQVTVDSTRHKYLSLQNTGCDTLTIDSIVSSYPEIFQVQPRTFPLKLKKGGRDSIRVSFKPLEEGMYLEAIEIGSNGGHMFIATAGEGTKQPTKSVGEKSARATQVFPNPSAGVVRIRRESSEPTLYWVVASSGNVVLQGQLKSNDETLDLRELPSGVYLLEISGVTHTVIRY